MKNAAVIGVVFFIMTILAKDVTAIGIQVWYRMNISYVAKNLCENKSRPEMKCNGKCYLAKQLAKTEGEKSEKEKSPLPVLKLKGPEAIATADEALFLLREFPVSEVHYYAYHNVPTSEFSENAEHPPSGWI